MQSPIWKTQVSIFVTHCITAFQVISAFISTLKYVTSLSDLLLQ